MNNLPVVPKPPAGCSNLQNASGVAGRDDVRLQRGDVARLAVAKLHRRLRLDEIVDARAAAADLRFQRREQFDAGNRRQQRARLRLDALRVREVTRVVVDDTRLYWMALRARLADLRQHL